jgi:heptosyltransferase-2
VKKILIIQTAFIGDVILATPLIEKLKEFYPDSHIDFLLRKGNEGLFNEHPKLNHVLIWDKKKEKYFGLLKLIKQVRASQYDLVVNLQRFAASGLLTSLSNGKQRIGFDKNPFSFGFTDKVKHEIGSGLHETVRNLKLIRQLTGQKYYRPRLYPTFEDEEKVLPLKVEKYVCIAPTSVWFTKQYPANKWLELVDRIDDKTTIYLLGAPGDFDAAEEIKNMANRENVINLCGQLSFLASAALMKGAQMNYVNDSAPMHMASAVNAPTTAIYCSTVPSFGFGPLATVSHVVETQEKLACRPCGLHGLNACPLNHYNCAQGINTASIPVPAE